MKKVLIASAALFFAAITNVHAQVDQKTDKKETVEKPQQIGQQTKSPVKPEALPETIKATLAGENYTGWVVNSAFLVKGATEYYEVTLAKDKETRTEKFDKAGKPAM